GNGGPGFPNVTNPNHIIALTEERYKLAMYYDPVAAYDEQQQRTTQWEMYDTVHDPDERYNLAWPGHRYTLSQAQRIKLEIMKNKLLLRVAHEKLKSLRFTDPLNVTANLCMVSSSSGQLHYSASNYTGEWSGEGRISNSSHPSHILAAAAASNAAWSTTAAAPRQTYVGTMKGTPTGNATLVLVTFHASQPHSLLIYSPVGFLKAEIAAAAGHNSASHHSLSNKRNLRASMDLLLKRTASSATSRVAWK
ncbi:hypothetical protein CEUSTIGMA_g4632.t1, partial [Chlamydomonas eustigma]